MIAIIGEFLGRSYTNDASYALLYPIVHLMTVQTYARNVGVTQKKSPVQANGREKKQFASTHTYTLFIHANSPNVT